LYAYYDNLNYLLQRLAAIGVLRFLGAHLWLAMIHPRLVLGHPEPFSDIAYEMRFHTPTLVVYLLGTLAVCYHLANGIFGFVCVTATGFDIKVLYGLSQSNGVGILFGGRLVSFLTDAFFFGEATCF
jgi:succinate dehydrogenase/fumarate reductase cytochrome b subunit